MAKKKKKATRKKKVTKMKPKAKKKPKKKKSVADKLNLKQRKFCINFATDREFFGNGVQSYAEAYDIDLEKEYDTAKVNASKLLTNANILAYINELLQVGLNEAHVDKQLAFLITQNVDFRSKLGAIKEFNALKNRITKKIGVEMTLAQALHEAMKDDNRS